MAINTTSSALHLNLPSSGPSQTRPPTLITIHPSVLAQILDHHSRRPTSTPRVIGTLLGIRTTTTSSTSAGSDEIEIRSCFGVPHSEDEEHVAVDMDYHKGMMDLMGKLGGKREGGGGEVIVGWYSSSPILTPYSALIQNFFTQECAAVGNQAIHLTVDAELKSENGGSGLGVKAFVSSQVGLNPKPENCVFLPVPCALKYNMSERAGLDLLSPANVNKPNPSLPPLITLSESLSQLSQQLSTIQSYVSSINAGTNSTPADAEIGRYLLEAVGRWKAESLTNEDGEEQGVKKGLQDLLSVSYLSTLLRSQVELSARLNLLT